MQLDQQFKTRNTNVEEFNKYPGNAGDYAPDLPPHHRRPNRLCEKTILIHEGTIYELKSCADVEWSLVLEVSVRAEDGSNGVEVREITVPVTGGNTAAILEKVASSGTVSDGRVTSG